MAIAYGGLNTKIAPSMMSDEMVTQANNFVIRGSGMQKAKGWAKFTSQQITDGEASPTPLKILRIDQYFKRDGNSYLIAMCDKGARFFRESTDLWIPITEEDYAETFVDQDSASGAATLYLDDTTGYSAGDHINIDPDGDGDGQEDAVVDSVSAGVSLTLKANLSITHTASTGDDVIRYQWAGVVDADSAAAQAVLNVDYTDRFTAGEAVIVGWDTSREELRTILSIQAGVSITFTENLTYEHTAAQADKVVRIAELATTEAVGWDSDISQDTFYATNYVDRVKKFDAVNSPFQFLDLGGLDDCEDMTTGQICRAKFLKVFEGFIVLGFVNENGVEIPQKIRWCQYGEFESWKNETDGTGQAGYFTFDGPDWIIGLYQMKRELMIYRERSIEAMSYVGVPAIFGFRRAETGIGLMAPTALVDLGDVHFFVGPDNMYFYDGISVQAVGDAVKQSFFSLLDPSKKSQVTAFYIEEEDEIWVSFATVGSEFNNKAFVFNVSLNVWSGPRDVGSRSYGYYERQASASIDELVGTIDDQDFAIDSRTSLANNPLNLMGSADGYVHLIGEVFTADGETMEGSLITKVTDCGDPGSMKRLQKIRLALSEVGTGAEHSVYVATRSNALDEPTWHGPYTLSVDADGEPWVFCDLSARYFQVELLTTASGGRIYEIELWFMSRGWKGVGAA